MAKVIIVLEDAENGIVNYQASCETPNETDENGNPTQAIQLAGAFIEKITTKELNNEIE